MQRQCTTTTLAGSASLFKSTIKKMEWSMGKLKKTTSALEKTQISSGQDCLLIQF